MARCFLVVVVACSVFGSGTNGPNCTTSGTLCDCTYTGTNPGGTSKYTISGGNITDSSSMQANELCVKASERWIRDFNGSIVRLVKQ